MAQPAKHESFPACRLVVRASCGGEATKSWSSCSWGRVIRTVNPIFGTESLQRQHAVALKIVPNSGTWRQNCGSGMRIELETLNHAARDADASEDEEDSESEDEFGFGMFGYNMFGGHRRRQRKHRKPDFLTAHAVMFRFQDVQDPTLRVEPAEEEVTSSVTSTSTVTSPTVSSTSTVTSTTKTTSKTVTRPFATVSFNLSVPARCFMMPRRAMDAFMKPTSDFAGAARRIEVGFSVQPAAEKFLASLLRGMAEAERLQRQERWSERVADFHQGLVSHQIAERAKRDAAPCLAGTLGLRAGELVDLCAQLALQPEVSFARKSIHRWNLLPPGAAISETLDVPIVSDVDGSAQGLPGILPLRLSGVDALWQRYFTFREADERAYRELLAEARRQPRGQEECYESVWESPRKRAAFTRSLRTQLAMALVSSRSFTAEEAREVSKGLFVHMLSVNECEDEPPRSVDVCVRIYSSVAEPSFLNLRYQVHYRARMSFTEKHDAMYADIGGVAALRGHVRKGLQHSWLLRLAARTCEGSQSSATLALDSTVQVRRNNGCATVPLVQLLLPEERMAGANPSGSSEVVFQRFERNKRQVAPVSCVNGFLAAVFGENHSFFVGSACAGRKPYCILARACGLYSSPAKRVQGNNWVMKSRFGTENPQQSDADGTVTDSEETLNLLRAQPTATAYCNFEYRAALSAVPSEARGRVSEFLGVSKPRPLGPGQMIGLSDKISASSGQSRNHIDTWDRLAVSYFSDCRDGPAAAMRPRRAAPETSDNDSKYYDSSSGGGSEEEEEAASSCSSNDQRLGDVSNKVVDHREQRARDLLLLEYLKQREEVATANFERAFEGSDDLEQMDSVGETQEAEQRYEIQKKIVEYREKIANRHCDSDLFEWKVSKYIAKMKSVDEGWCQDPDGSDGTSWASTDFDEPEPTPQELEAREKKWAENKERTPPLMDERMAKMEADNEAARQRSPERIGKVEEEMQKEEDERKAALAARKKVKADALNEIQRRQPQLWQKIEQDREKHLEKRIRLGQTGPCLSRYKPGGLHPRESFSEARPHHG